ncbi:OmpH family outer membrane protein [Parafilimonas sp.]|uniref:OmpH family outer membrane protein n=1 Tax=Parafilimonas sp. TaxID=1969739 RepID=UPI0039E3D227
MNKFLLGLNIVLLLALAYLYYAFYNNKPAQASAAPKTEDTADLNFKIAYFDIDSIDKNYVFAKETRDYLKGKNDAVEAKLNKIGQEYTSKAGDYQKRGTTMSQTEQLQMQEDLARLENYYNQQKQSLNQDFQSEYMQRMLALKNKIQAFLKTYSEQRGYIYVFATSSDDNIYYKDSVRNITGEVVKLLNEQYASEKKK